MRVVGGEWKGRPLVTPSGRGTRPTSDKVREAVFSVLAALPEAQLSDRADGGLAESCAGPLAGHRVLDAFAGSGALGIEALSRGAGACTFVDCDRAAIRALHANLQRLGVEAGSKGSASGAGTRREAAARDVRVSCGDARRVLPADARRGARYTLVFVDPPYEHYSGVRPALIRLLGPVLAPGAVLVVETAVAVEVDMPWSVVREKRYGDTRVTFLVAGAAHESRGVRAEHE